MAKKRANTNNKKKSSVAAINHARLDGDGDNEDIGNSNPRNNKWKGPKWKRGAKNNNGKQQQHGKKSFSNNNNSNDDDQYLRRTIESDGYKTVIEMAADGNCLFRSLSDQLYHDYGNGHEHVREEVCDFLEAHRDDFCAFLLLEEDEEDVTDFDDYVREMRGYGTWGGNVELVVASRLYDRNITIFSCPATAAANNNNNNNNNNSVHSSSSSEKGSGGASIPAELSAFTIHNDHDDSEHDAARKKKNRLPDILLSFHENDHYNSVRDSRNGRPPPPIKTYVKPGTVDDDDEYNDEYNERYYNNQQEQQQHDGYDTEEKTNTSEESATSASSTASTIDMDEHEQEDTAADTESATTTNSSSTVNPPPNPETATLRIKKNDACPCGSGQRYKKCCFAREKHARRVQQMQASKGLAEEESASARSPLQKDAKEDDAEVVMNGNFRVLTI